MQEVQRFNKVLKSFVLSGDIILLNLLYYFILDLDFHPYPHFSPYTQYKVLPILPFWLETLLL